MFKNIFKGQNILLITYVLLMVALLYMRDIGGASVNKMIFVALVVSVSLIAEYETLVSVIAFTLPLMCGLPGNYFLPVWVLLVLFRLNKLHEFHERGAVMFVVAIIFSELLHIVWYPFDVDIMQFVGYSCALLLLSVFATNNIRIDYSKPVLFFCIGCCVLLAAIFLIYTSNSMMLATEGGMRMGGDAYKEDGVMTLATNANNIGFLSSASIACAFALFYYKKLKLVPFLLIAIVSFYCGMFSVSRSWVITLALILVSYFVMNKQDRKYGYAILAVILVGGFYYFQSHADFLNMFIDRFTGDEIETGGHRTTLFAEYNDFLSEHTGNLIFGTGALIYKEVTNLFHSTHNSLQQVWLSYGILGFVFIMIGYWRALMKNYSRGQYMSVMPMIAVFFFLQTIQVLNPHNGMYPLITAFFVMKMVKQDETVKL